MRLSIAPAQGTIVCVPANMRVLARVPANMRDLARVRANMPVFARVRPRRLRARVRRCECFIMERETERERERERERESIASLIPTPFIRIPPLSIPRSLSRPLTLLLSPRLPCSPLTPVPLRPPPPRWTSESRTSTTTSRRYILCYMLCYVILYYIISKSRSPSLGQRERAGGVRRLHHPRDGERHTCIILLCIDVLWYIILYIITIYNII
jgi:hypothetical protein